MGKLPTPTRPGYRFKGWYIDGKLVDESKPITSTAPIPVAQWEWIKVTPGITSSPSQVEAGTEKVEVTVSCTTAGIMLDWRPFERILFSGGSKPSDVEAAVKKYIHKNNPNDSSGLKLTDIRYEGDYNWDKHDDSAYPANLYPEGVCPTPQLVLTFEGKAAAGQYLSFSVEPECFVRPVTKDEHIVLTESKSDMFTYSKTGVSITGEAAASSKDGPFTVKFDLNYKDAPKSEVPKEKTVVKGNAVPLPDGSKLTPPASSLEFYAWGILNEKDGKLYPWKESNPVTEDMTLYAGWVKKGSAVKAGQAIEAKPAETTKPSETQKPAETTKPAETPAAPAFTDVAATSPFAKAISWAVEKKITNGTTPTTFAPGTTCTRGHILTFLWRSQGSPEPTIANPYKDEIPGAFQKAAIWAHEKGLVSGDTFGSAVPCTRASSVTYMWKLAGGPEAKAASFKDVDASSDYAKAISWAVEQGVTNGTGDGTTFSPENTCTRGQIVTFLFRAYAK